MFVLNYGIIIRINRLENFSIGLVAANNFGR